jgi:hypothetical protein
MVDKAIEHSTGKKYAVKAVNKDDAKETKHISIATNTGWVFNTRFLCISYTYHTPFLVSNIANRPNKIPQIRVTIYLFCIRVTFFLPIQLSYLDLYFMHVSFLTASLWILGD